jgi:hypothetical protein
VIGGDRAWIVLEDLQALPAVHRVQRGHPHPPEKLGQREDDADVIVDDEDLAGQLAARAPGVPRF